MVLISYKDPIKKITYSFPEFSNFFHKYLIQTITNNNLDISVQPFSCDICIFFRPRLGPALQRVVATGLLWGLLAAIEAWLRLHHKQNDSNRDLLLSQAPLSLLDSAICWWVFVSLAHTMRTLQLRR